MNGRAVPAESKGVYHYGADGPTMSLSVTFLGTGGAVPTTQRNTSALVVRRAGDRFLFDAGEGTQRRMMRFGTGFDLDAVFLTHAHGDHVLGLPGLLQTLDFNDREAPLPIHAPAGAVRQVRELARVGDTNPDFRASVEPVSPGEAVYEREDYAVRAFEADHDTAAVGYALVEADRKGRFDRERAEELGVPVGPKFSRLHEGDPVELGDGTVVRPEQVVGPPRPPRGRTCWSTTRCSARTSPTAPPRRPTRPPARRPRSPSGPGPGGSR